MDITIFNRIMGKSTIIWLVVTGTMEWIMTFPSYWEFHHPN